MQANSVEVVNARMLQPFDLQQHPMATQPPPARGDYLAIFQ